MGEFHFEVCPVCEHGFPTTDEKQRFCSTKCRIRDNNNRSRAKKRVVVNKQCPSCGKGFETAGSKQKYCSKTCRYKESHIRVKIKKTQVFNRQCPTCEKSFETTDPRRLYCDGLCRHAGYISRHHRSGTVRSKGEVNTDIPCANTECRVPDKVYNNLIHLLVPEVHGGDPKDPNNQLPLCSVCHNMLHMRRIKMWDMKVERPKYDNQYWYAQALKSDEFEYF
jgi:predicted nucleic acid-binding Zn ribbon protein